MIAKKHIELVTKYLEDKYRNKTGYSMYTDLKNWVKTGTYKSSFLTQTIYQLSTVIENKIELTVYTDTMIGIEYCDIVVHKYNIKKKEDTK